MPTLLSEQVISLEFSDLANRVPILRPDLPPRRAPGLHQSGVLKYIAVERINILKPGIMLDEEYPLLWGLGVAWEEFAVSLHPDIIWQPGEETRDGISVNCDGLSWWWNNEPTLEEFKFTFKSEKSGEEWIREEWMHMHQARGYCWVYGPRVVRWHVCHVRGDYKSFGPIYKQYVVGFTDEEVEGTWRMITKNAAEAVRMGYAEIGKEKAK